MTATNQATRGETVDEDGDGSGVVRRALDRHAQRRRQGIPTLSVLLVTAAATGDGAGATGEAAWHRWVGAGRTGLRAVSVPWPRSGEDLRALETGVAPLWTPPPPPPTPPPAASPAAGPEGDALVVAVGLLAGRLERSVPPGAWVCGLLVPAAGLADYLAGAPESRAKAYLREGLIVPPGVATPDPAGAATVGGGADPGPARTAARRALGAVAGGRPGGAGPGVLAGVDAAADALDAALAAAPGETAEQPPGDRARSAAERFLFAVLDALPGTAGVFALNAPLAGNVCFGPRPAEVDLLAAGPRVAVEIDGYHHFTDADRYRRDRRKDALLQEHGFLVLRFLADDVVPRLEEVLDTIRAAVARRQPRP